MLMLAVFFLLLTGFSEEKGFDIEDLYDYQKEFESVEIGVCSMNRTKTYMDYRATTSPSSRQYWFIRNEMTVDQTTGFLYDRDGFIGVALGSYYGEIGDRFYFTFDNGIVLPLVKCEEKSDSDTDPSGCYHISDNSVIEFVIDRHLAAAYFGNYGNGLVLNGNYANYDLFSGHIIKVEKVLDTPNSSYVTFSEAERQEIEDDIFFYASGY